MNPADRLAPQPVYLALRIENNSKLPLDVLAELLAAIARDYKRFRGGYLSIDAFGRGSLIAYLHDLSDLADQANHLFDFSKNIIDLVVALIAGHIVIKNRRDPYLKTALALADSAIKSGGFIEISYEGPKSDKLNLKVAPEDVSFIKQRIIPREKQKADVPLLPPARLERLEDLAKAAVSKSTSEKIGSIESGEDKNDLLLLLVELVNLLKGTPEGRRALRELALRLRSEGHNQAAQLIWSYDG